MADPRIGALRRRFPVGQRVYSIESKERIEDRGQRGLHISYLGIT